MFKNKFSTDNLVYCIDLCEFLLLYIPTTIILISIILTVFKIYITQKYLAQFNNNCTHYNNIIVIFFF